MCHLSNQCLLLFFSSNYLRSDNYYQWRSVFGIVRLNLHIKNPDRMKPTVHSTISLSQSRVSGRSLFQIVNHMHIATCQRRKTKTVVTSSRRLHSKAKASFIPGHVWSNFFLSSTTNYKNTIQRFTVRFLVKRLELDRTTCSHQREYFPLTSLGTDEPIMIGLARTNCNLVALYTK